MISKRLLIISLLTAYAIATNSNSNLSCTENDFTSRILATNNAGTSAGFNPSSTGSNGLTPVAPPTSIPTNETAQSYTIGTCPDSASSVYDLTGLTDADRAELVNAHNYYRSIVAQGLSPGQPGATDMLEVYWDNGLANRAQLQADLCVMEHDTSAHRATITFPVAGQNIALTASSAKNGKYNLTYMIQLWYDEVYDLDGATAPVNSFANVDGIVIGHYTQLVWAKSYAVGCGFKFYEDTTSTPGFTWYTYLLYCNYGPPGNYLNQKIYTQGTFATSGCLDGASPTWQGLCIAGLQTTGKNPPTYDGSSGSNGGDSGSEGSGSGSTNTTNSTNTNNPTIPSGANNAGTSAGFNPASTGSNGLTLVAPPTTIPTNETEQSYTKGYCPDAASSVFDLTGLSGADRAELINAHNYYRSIVAQGLSPGQPGATDMLEVYWDNGLANRAQLQADLCIMEHDTSANRATNTFPTVGQNIAMTASSAKNVKYNLTKMVQMWYDEVFDLSGSSAPVDSFANVNGIVIGHYTQLAWAKSYAIGCGFKFYEDTTTTQGTTWYTYLLYCNYGPAGNYLAQKMYSKGTFATSGCKDGASPTWQGLCIAGLQTTGKNPPNYDNSSSNGSNSGTPDTSNSTNSTNSSNPTNSTNSTNNNNNNPTKPPITGPNNAGTSAGFKPSSTGSNGLTLVAPPTTIPTNETEQSYTKGNCPDAAFSVFDLTGLSGVDRAELVNAHNYYRSLVAQGLSPGQPGATDMLEVYWDNSLANRAQIQADLCIMEHDTSAHRATITFPTVGQNIAMTASSAKNVKYNLTKMVQMWYDEVFDLSGSSAPVDSFANVNGIVIGHYTQLAWAKSYAIGCGFKFYEDTTTTQGTTWYTYLLYCNYGPAGNYLAQKMYSKGTFATSGCKDGASPTWQGLCRAGFLTTGKNPPSYLNSSNSNSSNPGSNGGNSSNTSNSTNSSNPSNPSNTSNPNTTDSSGNLLPRRGSNLPNWAGVTAGFMPVSTGSNGLTPIAPPTTITSNVSQSKTMGYCPDASGGYLYDMRGLTDRDRAELVNAHNYFRSLTGQGKTKGQPAAADLFEITWDDGLASRAQLMVENCVFEHDSGSNRITTKFSSVGQNLALFSSSAKNPSYNLTAYIKMFYDEAFTTKGESLMIEPFKFSSGIGHYSQILWASSYAVGCGFIFYEKPTKTGYMSTYLLACNYGPAGNWINGKMYTAASFDPTGCPNGASASWQNLCAPPTNNFAVVVHNKIKINDVSFTPNVSGFYNHQLEIKINPVIMFSNDYTCSWYIGASFGSSLTIPPFTMGPAQTRVIAVTCTDKPSGKFFTITRQLQTKTPPTVSLSLNASTGLGTSSVFFASIASSTGSAPLSFRIGYYLDFNKDFSLTSSTFGSPIFAGTNNASFTLPNPPANGTKVVIIAIVQDSFGIAGYDLENITLNQMYIPDPTNFAQDLVNKTYTEPTALIKDVSIITSLVNFSAPSDDPKVANLANQLATSIVSTTNSSGNDTSTFIQAAKLLEPITSNPTKITKEVANQLVDYLTQQLSGTPTTTPTVDDTKVLLNLISNTFISFNSQISPGSDNTTSTEDTAKVQAIMGLTDSVAKQLTGNLAEGESQVISSSTVSIVVQKISATSPIALSSTDATSTSTDGLSLQVSLPQLPASFAAQGNVNIVFKVWADNPIKQVTTASTENTPTSKVVSLGVLDSNGEPMTVTGLNPPLTLSFKAKKSNNAPTCNYLNTTSLQWQTDGCTLKNASDEPSTDLVNVECECTHMTDFGVINTGSDPTSSSEFKVLDLQLLYATIPMTIVFVLLGVMFGVLDNRKGLKPEQGDPEYETMSFQMKLFYGIKNSHNFISLFTRANDPYPRYLRALTYLVRWYMINFVTALLYVYDSVSLESAGSIALSSLIAYFAVMPLSYLLDIACMDRLSEENYLAKSTSADKSLFARRFFALILALFFGVGSVVPTYAILHDHWFNFTLQWNVVETFLVQIGWDFLINQQLKVFVMMILINKLSDGKAKSFFKNVIHQKGHGAIQLDSARSPKNIVPAEVENGAPKAGEKIQEHEKQTLLTEPNTSKHEEKMEEHDKQSLLEQERNIPIAIQYKTSKFFGFGKSPVAADEK